MARNTPIALGLGGLAAIFLISGIQGKSLGNVIQGDFGKQKNPEGKPEGGEGEGFAEPGGAKGTNEPVAKNVPGGVISPFTTKYPISWGRSDQGVDGVTTPGAPMVAMGNGFVEIAHDPSGFGTNYPVLHIDGDGAFYYGHSVPIVNSGTRVKKGQVIAHANTSGQGNATTPGAFEIGTWPPGNFSTAGAAIRAWFLGLPKVSLG